VTHARPLDLLSSAYGNKVPVAGQQIPRDLAAKASEHMDVRFCPVLGWRVPFERRRFGLGWLQIG